MVTAPPDQFEGTNPLLSDSAEVWDHLIQAAGPASLLVVIEGRMSAGLKQRVTPEDIFQEALLHAWRDRRNCEWRGIKSFRSWLLTIIDRRIGDAAAYEAATKRGEGKRPVPFSALAESGSHDGREHAYSGPVASTTPSRIAIHKEQAQAMRAALEALPADLRDVVRLRLFEQRSVAEIAGRLGIGLSAVIHRFRRGSEMYHRRLVAEMGTRSLSISRGITDQLAEESSPRE